MGLPEVKADIKLLREQILSEESAATSANAKLHLTENLLPLLEGIVDALMAQAVEMQSDIDDLNDAVDEIIEQTGEILHPETATKIAGVLELGRVLVGELKQLLPSLDEVRRKRVGKQIALYLQGTLVVGEVLAAITVEPDQPDQPEPGGDDAAGAGDDEHDEHDDGDDDEDGEDDEVHTGKGR